MTSLRHLPILVALCLSVAAIPATAAMPDTVCYRAGARRADRADGGGPYAVDDRFGARGVLAGKPVGLCRAVGDDDGVAVQVVRRATAEGGRKGRRVGEAVDLSTRFGAERVRVKSLGRVVLAGVAGAEMPSERDERATCYLAKGAKRGRGVVVLGDARGEHVLRVGAPRRLCVFESGAQQICHAAKAVRGAPVDGGGATVVATALGSERLVVARVAELCVAAGESEPPPPEPGFFLRVTPSAVSVTAGAQARLEGRAFFDEGGSEDWSDRLTWTSSDETVAVVHGSAGGAIVDALAPGTTAITAVHAPTGVSSADRNGNGAVTVIWNLEKLTMDPPAVRKPVGGTEDYTVIGHFPGGVSLNLTQRVVYSASAPNVVSVPNEPGRRSRVHALAPGIAWISARDPISGIRTTDVGNDAILRVAGGVPFVQIDPGRESRLVLDVATARQFTAVAVFPDGIGKNVTQECAWSSTDASVIAPDPTPAQASRFVAVGPGTAQVVCVEPASGRSGSTEVDVVTGEMVGLFVRGADHPPIVAGTPRRLTAIGTFAPFLPSASFPYYGSRNVTQDVTYVSLDPDVVIAPNEPGDRSRLESVSPGGARVYAVDPATSLESNEHLAVNFGALLGVGLRGAPWRNTILKGATYTFGLRANYEGGSLDLVRFAPNVRVALESDDPSIVGVLPDAPTIVGVGAGTTQVRPRLVDFGLEGPPVTITVKGDVNRLEMSPTSVRRAIGEIQRFSVRAFSPPDFSDSYTQLVEYRSSDPSVAVALNTPFDRSAVRMVGAGTAVISARLPGTSVDTATTGTSATVEVLPGAIERVTIAPVTRTIARGDRTAFTATGHYGDGRTINVTPTVTWKVSDATVARTGGGPRIESVGPGTTRVVAVHPSGVSSSDSNDDATLIVAELVQVRLTPATRSASAGTSVRYTTVGVFGNGSEINLTQDASYWTSDQALAVAENDDGDRSRIDLVAPGPVTVYAWVFGHQASATLTITE